LNYYDLNQPLIDLKKYEKQNLLFFFLTFYVKNETQFTSTNWLMLFIFILYYSCKTRMWTMNIVKLQEKIEKDYDNHDVYSSNLITMTCYYAFIRIYL